MRYKRGDHVIFVSGNYTGYMGIISDAYMTGSGKERYNVTIPIDEGESIEVGNVKENECEVVK